MSNTKEAFGLLSVSSPLKISSKKSLAMFHKLWDNRLIKSKRGYEMLNVKIDDDTNLVVYSEWDSGSHKCFKALIHRKGEYCGKTLNQHLTKEQIQEIELTILGKLFSMLKG